MLFFLNNLPVVFSTEQLIVWSEMSKISNLQKKGNTQNTRFCLHASYTFYFFQHSHNVMRSDQYIVFHFAVLYHHNGLI